ncbi:hypothetical protein PMAYCL1PPCAC_04830, partial [Pristionchus mayeri]
DDSFEPDHPRYRYAACCNVHVVTAARCVSIVCLLAFLYQAFIPMGLGAYPCNVIFLIIHMHTIILLLIAVFQGLSCIIVSLPHCSGLECDQDYHL